MMNGKIRIIGGKWRGRKLKILGHTSLRPTSDRIRETLFNWLTPKISGCHCLDLFAGSGALGIEAVSRGAKSALLIEKDYKIARNLKQHIVVLNSDKLEIIQSDALYFLKQNATQFFDLVFLDPPFRQNLLEPCWKHLENQGWLSPHAQIYIESERHFDITKLPANWQIIRQQTAGQVAYFLLQRE